MVSMSAFPNVFSGFGVDQMSWVGQLGWLMCPSSGPMPEPVAMMTMRLKRVAMRITPQVGRPRTQRWVGDKDCWTIDFPLDGVEIPDPSQVFPIDLQGWSLTPTRRESDLGLLSKDWSARCIILRSPLLRVTYALPKTDFWVDFLSQWIYTPTDSPSGDIIYADADIRKHIEFCRRFSNKLDGTIEAEQRSHHRTLVAYNEELKVLQRRMEESERKIANKNGGLEYKLHIMEKKVDGVTEKLLGFVTEVVHWVKNGQQPEKFDEIACRFAEVNKLLEEPGPVPVEPSN